MRYRGALTAARAVRGGGDGGTMRYRGALCGPIAPTPVRWAEEPHQLRLRRDTWSSEFGFTIMGASCA
jgi:hypothetical protein